jgi:ribosomal protein L11 methylase PrmA
MANITKNILIEDLEMYYQKIKIGGLLFTSGFYISDRNDLIHAAAQAGFTELSEKNRNEWSSLVLKKIDRYE